MNDHEKVFAVRAKLRGDHFYVGQEVRYRAVGSGSKFNKFGVVVEVLSIGLVIASAGRRDVTLKENAEPV